MAVIDVENIILRFRDLGLQSGETVRRHNEISAKAGSVWWGWWAKGGEAVPEEAFRKLLGVVRGAGGLSLLLVDSGRTLVYRATCSDIDWERTHARKRSPDPAMTPGYYNDAEFLAWFKLGALQEADPAELRYFSYVRIDELFAEGASRFVPFYGKRIYSVDELIQQNRTIWFIRRAREHDPSHQVELLDSRKTEPAHFAKHYAASASPHVLWISDLHFERDGAEHAFPRETDAARQSLKDRLLHELLRLGYNSLGAVVISGDLTWRADPEEFRQAEALIARLASHYQLTNDHIVVCPGNHDLAFSADASDKDAPITATTADARRAFSEFYTRQFYLAPNEYLSSGRRLLFSGAFPVEILALNSSFLQQRKGLFQGHGFIGRDQLDGAATALGWDENAVAHPIRIVMMHHHVLPTTYQTEPKAGAQYSVVLDAEALMRFALKYKVGMILHGHMHQPFDAKIARRAGPGWRDVSVAGNGTAGAKKELGEVKHNVFAVLSFERPGGVAQARITYFSIDPVNPSAKLWDVVLPLGT